MIQENKVLNIQSHLSKFCIQTIIELFKHNFKRWIKDLPDINYLLSVIGQIEFVCLKILTLV